MRAKAVLAAAVIFGTLLCGCARSERESPVPERITLYIEQESRIVTLDYTEYLTGCIFAAADPSFQRETLLAVGISCSGQALYRISAADNADNKGRPDRFGADLSTDTELCPEWLSPEQLEQEYGDKYEEYFQRISGIAEEAAEIVPCYNEKPANLLLCRVSAGITDDGGLPYLPSLRLSADKESRYYSCSTALTEEIVRKSISDAVGRVALPPDREQWFSGAERTDSGTLVKINFGGTELSGEQLRRALGLRSTNIGIEYAYGTFTFTTLGEGNNTGMSVYTAELLARGGSSAGEILEQFYPGIELKNCGGA